MFMFSVITVSLKFDLGRRVVFGSCFNWAFFGKLQPHALDALQYYYMF